MSIAKLNYLLETKNQIKNAIISKGVEVSDVDTFRSYVDKISNISNSSQDEFYNLRTNNGTDGGGLFAYTSSEICTNSNFIEFVQKLDVSKMNDYTYMFYNSKFNNLDFSTWKINDKVTGLSYMFYGSNFTKLDLKNWDTSNINSIAFTFNNSIKLTEIDLTNWDTSKIENAMYAFQSCSKLTLVKGVLDLIKMKTLTQMFGICKELVGVSIKNLNQTGLDLSSSTKLSYESLMYLINNLVETTTTKTVTLGTTNLAKLTDEEKAIATSKGWTLG